MPTLPGSAGNDASVLYTLSAVGVSCGALVLLGALMLRTRSVSKAWGTFVAVCSLPSIICGGGFIAGVILAVLSGKATYSPRIENSSTKAKLRFLKMRDSTGKMRIEGSGPKIMAPLFVTFAVTAGLSYLYQPTLSYPIAATSLTLPLGVTLLAVGIPFWLLSVAMFLNAWQQEKLETRGPFAVMPNPIYSSFIVFIVPGLSLILNWWPVLLTSVTMYIAEWKFVAEEDKALHNKFGQDYERYRKRVLLKFL
ncbi:MAG: hypothetical protein NWE98_09090 [Candidatus Bathyarchaeota archaeon]|nr:hypothetical protein [Candidatus Bathyarchaeota archaeon]